MSSSYLQKPVAPSVKRGDDGGMDVAAVQALGTQKERKQSRVSEGNHRPRRQRRGRERRRVIRHWRMSSGSRSRAGSTQHWITAPQGFYFSKHCYRLQNRSSTSPAVPGPCVRLVRPERAESPHGALHPDTHHRGGVG